MPKWGTPDFRLEIEEVFGNEGTLDLGSNLSTLRKFQVRQVPRADGLFEPIPYVLAKLIFHDFILRFARFYDGLPFRRTRFTEDEAKIGEIFDAEVEYSLEIQEMLNEQGEREFTLPTFSMMGGKKKQFLPVITKDKDGEAINEVKRYTKSSSIKPVKYEMIGWDGKKFNGVELETADLQFMVPAWYPASCFKFEFMKRFKKFIGTVNSEPFYGMEAGEVKYLGPEQSWVTRTIETGMPNQPVEMIRVIELQHQFHFQATQENVKIGDIEIDEIPGWDYIDVHYEESLVDIGDGKKTPLAVPCQVDVVPVCKRKDFLELFNGTILEELWEGPPL